MGFTLILLSFIYAGTYWVIWRLVKRVKILKNWAVLLSALLFAFFSSSAAALSWPIDSSVYYNVFACLLGDEVYNLAIEILGDPGSAQAHFTIPWMLRVPQVYIPTALGLFGFLGAIGQRLYNQFWNRKQPQG